MYSVDVVSGGLFHVLVPSHCVRSLIVHVVGAVYHQMGKFLVIFQCLLSYGSIFRTLHSFLQYLVSRALDLLSRALDLLSRALDLVSRALDLLSRALDLLTRALDLVSRALDLVSRSLDL